MKKFMFRFLTIIQFLLVIGLFVLEDLTSKHMTMMRIALYKKRVWEAKFPIDNMLFYTKALFVAIAVIFIISFIIIVIKKKGFYFHGPMQILSMALISGGSALFIGLKSIDAMPTYYFAILILLIINALQLIKVPFYLRSGKAV